MILILSSFTITTTVTVTLTLTHHPPPSTLHPDLHPHPSPLIILALTLTLSHPQPSPSTLKVKQLTWIDGKVQASIVPIDDTIQCSNSVLRRTATLTTAKLQWAPIAFQGTPKEWINMTTYLTTECV